MAEPDELFSLRNLFFLGSFQQAINEAARLTKLPPHLNTERDEFVYRSHIALRQYDLVLREISDDPNTPVSIRAIKLLATFLHQKDTREVALLQSQEWMQDPVSANNTTLQLVAALMRLYNDECMEAIKILRHGTTLEQLRNHVAVYCLGGNLSSVSTITDQFVYVLPLFCFVVYLQLCAFGAAIPSN